MCDAQLRLSNCHYRANLLLNQFSCCKPPVKSVHFLMEDSKLVDPQGWLAQYVVVYSCSPNARGSLMWDFQFTYQLVLRFFPQSVRYPPSPAHKRNTA